MKFLGIDFGPNKKKVKDPQITEPDRRWMDEIYGWFIATLSYPTASTPLILFTQDFFPSYFNFATADALVEDFKTIFAMQDVMISVSIHVDIRDTSAQEFQIEGPAMDIDLEVLEKNGAHEFIIHLSNQLSTQQERLPSQMATLFSQILLIKIDPNFATRDDARLHAHLLSIFFNLGYLIAPKLQVVERYQSGGVEGIFSSGTEVPMPLYAYVLALHHYVAKAPLPKEVAFLPSDMRKEVQRVYTYLETHRNGLRNEKTIAALGFETKGWEAQEKNALQESIEWFRRAAEYFEDDLKRANALNSLGYALTLNNQHEEAMNTLREALRLDAENGYILSNIAYLLVLKAQLSEAEEMIERALEKPYSDVPYIQFCDAVRLHTNKEFTEAETLFEELILEGHQNEVNPIDLLEYHYALLLADMGQKEKALNTLKEAVERGETNAIQLLKKWQLDEFST